jgi:hypothetical protein
VAKSKTMPIAAQITHALNVDRDDPFLGRRLAQGNGGSVDFSRTRRIPALLEERFTLVHRKRG